MSGSRAPGARRRLVGRGVTSIMPPHRLDTARHLDWLSANYEAVLTVPPDQLDEQVVACPGWTVASVADHFARGAVAFRIFLTTPPDQNPLPQILESLPDHASGVAAVGLARRNVDELLAVAGSLDPATRRPFVTGPADVATWCWHMASETWIHRADVEHTLHGTISRLDAGAGFDALEWSTMIRLRNAGGQQGERLPPTVRCQATDAEDSTMLGDGPAEVMVSGAASDLALRLWNRPHGTLVGDGDAFAAWTSAPIISPLD